MLGKLRRAVVSYTRDPGFESSRQQFLRWNATYVKSRFGSNDLDAATAADDDDDEL